MDYQEERARRLQTLVERAIEDSTKTSSINGYADLINVSNSTLRNWLGLGKTFVNVDGIPTGNLASFAREIGKSVDEVLRYIDTGDDSPP